jgi:hypothetical protein
MLKSKANPTKVKVGITSLKSLRVGTVMIEASSKNEVKTLGDKIGENCAELEVHIQKIKNAR